MEGIAAAAGSLPRRLRNGAIVVRQGDPTTALFVVLDGVVRLSATLPSGRRVVIAQLGRGDVFGEASLLPDPTSPVEAKAIGDVRLLSFGEGELVDLLGRRPAAAAEIVRLLARRLHGTASALEDALARDVPARVSRRLCDLVRLHGAAQDARPLRLSLTQEDLAGMVGASRESVNRSLAALAATGLVRTGHRRVVITDVAALFTHAYDETGA